MKTADLDNLQQNLTYAFKWMAMATEQSKEGNFDMAAYNMATALQYWQHCQHIKDKYIDEDVADSLDWNFFTNKALDLAKKELTKGE